MKRMKGPSLIPLGIVDIENAYQGAIVSSHEVRLSVPSFASSIISFVQLGLKSSFFTPGATGIAPRPGALYAGLFTDYTRAMTGNTSRYAGNPGSVPLFSRAYFEALMPTETEENFVKHSFSFTEIPKTVIPPDETAVVSLGDPTFNGDYEGLNTIAPFNPGTDEEQDIAVRQFFSFMIAKGFARWDGSPTPYRNDASVFAANTEFTSTLQDNTWAVSQVRQVSSEVCINFRWLASLYLANLTPSTTAERRNREPKHQFISYAGPSAQMGHRLLKRYKPTEGLNDVVRLRPIIIDDIVTLGTGVYLGARIKDSSSTEVSDRSGIPSLESGDTMAYRVYILRFIYANYLATSPAITGLTMMQALGSAIRWGTQYYREEVSKLEQYKVNFLQIETVRRLKVSAFKMKDNKVHVVYPVPCWRAEGLISRALEVPPGWTNDRVFNNTLDHYRMLRLQPTVLYINSNLNGWGNPQQFTLFSLEENLRHTAITPYMATGPMTATREAPGHQQQTLLAAMIPVSTSSVSSEEIQSGPLMLTDSPEHLREIYKKSLTYSGETVTASGRRVPAPRFAISTVCVGRAQTIRSPPQMNLYRQLPLPEVYMSTSTESYNIGSVCTRENFTDYVKNVSPAADRQFQFQILGVVSCRTRGASAEEYTELMKLLSNRTDRGAGGAAEMLIPGKVGAVADMALGMHPVSSQLNNIGGQIVNAFVDKQRMADRQKLRAEVNNANQGKPFKARRKALRVEKRKAGMTVLRKN